jgi:uncharacterized SAM-binding protein YcdF (DUF218 family)
VQPGACSYVLLLVLLHMLIHTYLVHVPTYTHAAALPPPLLLWLVCLQVLVLVEQLHSVTASFDKCRAVRYQQSLAKELRQHRKVPQSAVRDTTAAATRHFG